MATEPPPVPAPAPPLPAEEPAAGPPPPPRRTGAAAPMTPADLRYLQRIYDLYRLSSLNAKYYGYKLKKWRRINYVFDIVIALSASSGIASWAIWQTDNGRLVWAVVGGIAALLAVVKSTFNVSNQVELLTKLFSGHQTNFLSLERTIQIVSDQEAVDDDVRGRFNSAFDRFAELSKHDDPYPDRKLLEFFQKHVNEEIPANRLWVPRPPAVAPVQAVAAPQPFPPAGSAAPQAPPQAADTPQ